MHLHPPSHRFLALVGLLLVVQPAHTQTWCGKNYKASLPIVPPGGKFPIPASTASPHFALRCGPAIQPYLAEDAREVLGDATVLIDTPVRYSQLPDSSPINLVESDHTVSVSVSIDGTVITSGTVPLNATNHHLDFRLTPLTPRAQAYTLSCTATYRGQTFHATGSLSLLPDSGSVTKINRETGILMAKPANGQFGTFSSVFPIGFYTDMNYILSDPSIPAQLASQGFTVVHPNPSDAGPSLASLETLDAVFDALQAAGLYVMLDMRLNYMNATAVKTQVERYKSRPNLLTWYTGDEPDGTSDPLNATSDAYNLIASLDGGDGKGGVGYHPVSLVLNCENYFWSEYARGTDIVMQDTYMIGNNVTFSTVWGTVCTQDYGDCGCDNCKGSFEDITTRMDEFRERLFINGWEQTKSIWTVPQAFGNETYWKRYPTGQEYVVQSVLGINHGAKGVVAWDDPTSGDIITYASILAKGLAQMKRYIINPQSTFRQVTLNKVDFGVWTLGSESLVLGTNTNYSPVTISLAELGFGVGSSGLSATQLMNTGVQFDPARAHLIFQSVGSGGFVIKST